MTRSLLLTLALLLAPAFATAQGCPGGGPTAVCERGLSAPPAPDKGTVGPSARKIASSLRNTAAAVQSRVANGAGPSELSALSTDDVKVNEAGEIQVYVIVTAVTPDRVAQLEALGLRVELTLAEHRLIQGWVPAGAIDPMAGLDFVVEIRPPGYPVRHVGAQQTQGDSIHRADVVRVSPGVTGAGIKVGVMSDGVDHLADSQASLDLGPVQVLKNPGGDEGVAMLEIVHDLAPGAALAFYGPTTSADMVAGINALAAAGARVVVDDITFLDEPKFQDGMIAQAARNFATGGRVYATSAGNSAMRHYRATYSRAGSPGNFFHNYGGGDIGNTFTIPNNCNVRIVLQWNNPNGASADDFDLILANSAGTPIAVSTGFQTGTQNAFEFISFTNTTGASLVNAFIAINEFLLVSPPTSLILDYFVYTRCAGALQYVTSADSLVGHAAVNEVLSVAALGATTPTVAETFSSRGPGSISFPSPQTRSVPNISGIDCVSTQVGFLGFFVIPFCGTSAAAPHVAAIAALVMQRNPTMTSQQYHDVLTGTAVDLGPAGFDFTFGFGRADAVNAVTATPPPLTASVAVNQGVFSVGQTLIASASVTNPGEPATADFFIGLLMPDGVTLFFLTPGGSAVGTASNPTTFRPIAPGVSLVAPFSVSVPNVFSYTWLGSEPRGPYLYFLLILRTGAAASGVITSSDIMALATVGFMFP